MVLILHPRVQVNCIMPVMQSMGLQGMVGVLGLQAQAGGYQPMGAAGPPNLCFFDDTKAHLQEPREI